MISFATPPTSLPITECCSYFPLLSLLLSYVCLTNLSFFFQQFYKNDFEIINSLLTFEHLISFTQHNLEPEDVLSLSHRASYCTQNGQSYNGNINPRSFVPVSCTNTSQRFTFKNFHFDLINLISKSQHALVKFALFYQSFGAPLSTEQNEDDVASETEKNSSNSEDSCFNPLNNCGNIMLYSKFLLKLIKFHDKELSFSHLNTIDFMKIMNQRIETNDKRTPFFNVDLFEKDESIEFNCYCKRLSQNCIFLTIVPSSYKEIISLSSVFSRNDRNENLIAEMSNKNGECYGALTLPMFNFKLTFESLTDMILNGYQRSPLADLYFDYSQKRSILSQFDVNTMAPKKTLGDDITLNGFCNTMEMLYWNSFIDAVYKSFRYGFQVDEMDIELACLDDHCFKLYEHINLTKLLCHSCDHWKSLVRVYIDENVMGNNFELFHKIVQHYQEDLVEPTIIDRKLLHKMFCEKTVDCDDNKMFKDAFVRLVQSHFTPIPNSVTNEDICYFFDYENIQMKKFSLGNVDIKKNQSSLCDFFKKIENKSISLQEFEKIVLSCSRMLDQDGKDGNNKQPAVDDDEDPDGEEEEDMAFLSLMNSKPFFVSFIYSIQLNGNVIIKADSIPTCLYELLCLFDTLNVHDLDNIQVYLSIEVISQNLENVDRPPVKRMSRNTMTTEFNSEDVQVCLKNTLNEFQVYKYIEFVKEIEWLITDEVVSLSHNSFKVNVNTLDTALRHIKVTRNSNTSFLDRVDLRFLSPQVDESYETFVNQLKRLQFCNYQLCELNGYFYVIHMSLPEHGESLIYTATSRCQSQANSRECLVFNDAFFDEITNVSYKKEEPSSNYSPNFWLILTLDKETSSNETVLFSVGLHYHSRQSIYLYGMEIFKKLKKTIEDLCKNINQKFLLNSMCETQKCDNLLISSEEKDPFVKTNLRNAFNTTPISNVSFFEKSNTQLDAELDLNDDICFRLNKSHFLPGSFACDIVWDKHFSLHSRLYANNLKEGFATIKEMLRPFSVSNRNNLYVYKEKTGSIFYFRIYQIDCSQHVFAKSFFTFENLSELSGYYFDNLIDLESVEGECDADGSLAHNDSDRDTDSITSLNLSNTKTADKLSITSNQCILLNVHGLTQPSKDIKENMVGSVQKRLDDVVLDILIKMLNRNPLSKIAHEDVCFIQSPNSDFKSFSFIINEYYYPFINNVKSYIRQNLSTFMFTPKYAESSPEHHFKVNCEYIFNASSSFSHRF